MSHPLVQRVRAVGRRSQRLLLLYGVSCFLGLVLVAAFVAAVADYCLRFRDQGVRIILSASVLVWLAWCFWRFIVPAAWRRWTSLQVACRIERRFPQLRDRLSSSIAFLEQAEPGPGSADLRRQLISETSSLTARLNLFDALDPTLPRRVLFGLIAVLVVIAGICLMDRQGSWLAARRLAIPWSDVSWPRWNELAFVDPRSRIAAGEDFEIELIDLRGRLPDEVMIEYWLEGDDAPQLSPRKMKRIGDRMIDQLSNVTRPFRCRAYGGDHDTMPWHLVEVVEPPRVVDFQIQLQPPAYTGWPAEQSGRHLRVLEGTQITLHARTNKPLEQVRWHGTAAEDPQVLAAVQDQDALGFSWPREPFVARESGNFWFALTDRQGVTSDRQLLCELQVIRDQPPTVSIESPGLGTLLTPPAVVPLKAIIKDDLAIDQVALYHSDREVLLGSPAGDRQEGIEQPERTGSGDLRVVEYAWDLSETAGLAPGDAIEFYVTASDFKPQVGESQKRRLNIVSSDEFERRVDQRQTGIRDQLAEVLRIQRRVRLQVGSLLVQLDEAGQLQAADVELLQASEMQQRTVRSLLENQQDGVRARVQSLLADSLSNRLQQAAVEAKMTRLLAEIDQLGEQYLDDIEQHLRQARDSALAGEPGARGAGALRTAGAAQEAVIARLERLLDEFDQWEGYRQFAREVAQILDSQDQLGRDTQALSTLGKAPGDLAEQETAALRRLALRQRELARQFDRLQGGMQRAADEEADAASQITSTVARALQVAREDAVGGLMREAAEGVEQNQLGRVDQLQQRIEQGLEKLIDTLASRQAAGRTGSGQDALADLVPQLAEMLAAQDSVAEGTRELVHAKTQQGGRLVADQLAQLRGLASQQQELAEGAGALAEPIADAQVVAFALRSAAREMQRAAAALQQAALDQTTTAAQAAASGYIRQLLAALQVASQQQQPSEDQPEPTPDQPSRSGLRLSELQLLKEMQQQINRRTAEIDLRRESAGAVSDAMQRELEHLTAEQARLAEVVLQLAE